MECRASVSWPDVRLKAAPCPRSAGRRRTCAGLLKAPTWPPSTNVALHCGAARSSNRFRGSATRACPSSTSHRARGERRPPASVDTVPSVQSGACAYSMLVVFPQVRGDLQSAHGHQGGPPGHHHLGHPDRTEKERLPLRELRSLAHFQVSPPYFPPPAETLRPQNPDKQTLSSQVESRREVFRQDVHRHSEHL